MTLTEVLKISKTVRRADWIDSRDYLQFGEDGKPSMPDSPNRNLLHNNILGISGLIANNWVSF